MEPQDHKELSELFVGDGVADPQVGIGRSAENNHVRPEPHAGRALTITPVPADLHSVPH